jgi:hypothetical protein
VRIVSLPIWLALSLATAALAAGAGAAGSTAITPFSVKLTRDPCFGSCPIYSVTVHGDGRVVYVGTRFVAAAGTRRARISPAAVKRLRKGVSRARVFGLASRYDRSNVSDLPAARLTVRVGPRTKRIYHYFGDMGAPKRLWTLECLIDTVARTSRWVGHTTADLCRSTA